MGEHEKDTMAKLGWHLVSYPWRTKVKHLQNRRLYFNYEVKRIR